MVAVACGDDCTAAITAGGTLYMWGWLPGASSARALLVPVPMRGGLSGKRVTQVGLLPAVFILCSGCEAACWLCSLWGLLAVTRRLRQQPVQLPAVAVPHCLLAGPQ